LHILSPFLTFYLNSSPFEQKSLWHVCRSKLRRQKLAKVLLVDNDLTTSFLNARLLSALEVAEQFLVARNGVEGLQTVEQLCAELNAFTEHLLILLDVNMPVMNGIQFLETYQ
jgi:CheY-like chemotaxis protein